MKKLSALILIFAASIMCTGCMSALQKAANGGQTETIKKLLDDGVDINEKYTGVDIMYPPLSLAIANGHIETVRLLLDRGVDVNRHIYCPPLGILFTPVECAVHNGRADIVNLLFDRGAAGVTPLHRAAAAGQTDKVKNLLDKGADMNAKDHYGHTPLSNAAANGHQNTVILLLERGANIYAATAYLENDAIKNPGGESKAGLILLEKFTKKEEPVQTFPTGSQSSLNTGGSQPSSFIKSDVDEIPQLASLPANNSYAVIIGIESYRGLPKSSFSKQDAVLMKAYLKVFGFQERNIELLTDERASKTDIEKSLEAWLPNRVKKDSTVFIYYSGHGSPDPASGEAYIVPYDGDPNYLSVTGYSLKRLYETLGKLNAREVVVVLDSCFSGAGGRSVLAQGARPLVMMTETTILSSDMAILTATQGSQISTSSPEKGHGIFTYYFLKALKEGKKNIADIYEYIKPQVEDEAKVINVQQSPSVNPDIEKLRGRFVLRK